MIAGESTIFHAINRNKKSYAADLKNADDLELLMKVLEANKTLFTKTERVATDLVVKVTKTSSKVDRSDTEGCAKADGLGTNANRLTQILTP